MSVEHGKQWQSWEKKPAEQFDLHLTHVVACEKHTLSRPRKEQTVSFSAAGKKPAAHDQLQLSAEEGMPGPVYTAKSGAFVQR